MTILAWFPCGGLYSEQASSFTAVTSFFSADSSPKLDSQRLLLQKLWLFFAIMLRSFASARNTACSFWYKSLMWSLLCVLAHQATVSRHLQDKKAEEGTSSAASSSACMAEHTETMFGWALSRGINPLGHLTFALQLTLDARFSVVFEVLRRFSHLQARLPCCVEHVRETCILTIAFMASRERLIYYSPHE